MFIWCFQVIQKKKVSLFRRRVRETLMLLTNQWNILCPSIPNSYGWSLQIWFTLMQIRSLPIFAYCLGCGNGIQNRCSFHICSGNGKKALRPCRDRFGQISDHDQYLGFFWHGKSTIRMTLHSIAADASYRILYDLLDHEADHTQFYWKMRCRYGKTWNLHN